MAEVAEQAENVDLLKEKYLTFFLAGQCFGLDIQYVLEIISVQSVTKVPKIPEFIVGIINLRGKVIPIIDMRIRFHKEEKVFDKETCIIVVELNETVAGLIVDGVDEVVDIPDEAISEPPHVDWDYSSNFLQGVAQQNGVFRLILDCDKILND